MKTNLTGMQRLHGLLMVHGHTPVGWDKRKEVLLASTATSPSESAKAKELSSGLRIYCS
jgi:hypothetical protein